MDKVTTGEQRQRLLRVFLAAHKSGSMSVAKPRTAETLWRAAGLAGCGKAKYIPQDAHVVLASLRLKENGAWPIASSVKGFWYALTPAEMEPTIHHMTAKRNGIDRSLAVIADVIYGREL